MESEPRSRPGTPTWEIAELYPTQGRWTECDYLALDTNRLIEFNRGVLEFLPMTTPLHQAISQYLFLTLRKFLLGTDRGEVFLAPLRTRTIEDVIREPDVVYAAKGRIVDRRAPLPQADLVMEVVSEGSENRRRDEVVKRAEYAAAGIAEYWIVDYDQKTMTVLELEGDTYRVHGECRPGARADSVLLPGFTVDVTACFDAGEGK
ncbi:MAG: Uma2 family endonuclease [Planctomycetota bacterium]|nr:MAG: Uma2 family endonuclease [Planctomycetota bacterium]